VDYTAVSEMSKKRTTMEDVAKAAGVSRTTVSFVLNNIPNSNIADATRERVLQVARELDYAPNTQALNLVTGRTMMIALVVRKTTHQMASDAFLGAVIEGIMQAIEPHGYHLMIHAAQPDGVNSTYRDLIRTRKADGLVISSPMVSDAEVRLLHDEGTPVVLQGASTMEGVASIDVDNEQGAYDAVRHLIELGHRRIGHISNAPFSYAASCERLNGYRKALAEAGIPFDRALVREGNFTAESGYEPMYALLDLEDRPTAVFIGSDEVALGALDAARQRGITAPDDLSVIGFDNLPVGRYLQPPLTTVHLPAFDLGREAGNMILALVRSEHLPRLKVSLPTRLILRGSTAPVPA